MLKINVGFKTFKEIEKKKKKEQGRALRCLRKFTTISSFHVPHGAPRPVQDSEVRSLQSWRCGSHRSSECRVTLFHSIHESSRDCKLQLGIQGESQRALLL